MMGKDIESGQVEPNWVRQMREDSKRWRNQSIYEVPKSMKHKRCGAFEPQTVSIGPYHHGAEHLKGMEEHKQRAFLAFLDRSKKPAQCYLDALAPVVGELRSAYHDLAPGWKDDTKDFRKLMIVDGCFVLEIMRMATNDEWMGYESNDPVFSRHGKLCFVPCLRRDMLMLENQIPLLVLVTLLEAEGDNRNTARGLSKEHQLSVLVLDFFSQSYRAADIPEYGKCLHILALYHRSMLHCLPRRQKPPPKKERCSGCLIPCKKEPTMKTWSATELTHAGIRFEPSQTKCLNDVSSERGVLKLPTIMVDDALESKYLNMIAFEQLHADTEAEVSSFVCFLDTIIHGARDVELLRLRGIIEKVLSTDQASSDDAVAKVFNSLSRDITLDPGGSIAAEVENVKAYCRMPLPRFLVYSKHTYEHVSSWVSLSILGAISLFALTGVPAVYTVLDFYRPDK